MKKALFLGIILILVLSSSITSAYYYVYYADYQPNYFYSSYYSEYGGYICSGCAYNACYRNYNSRYRICRDYYGYKPYIGYQKNYWQS